VFLVVRLRACSLREADVSVPLSLSQDVVRQHFLLKRAHIRKVVRGWLEEAKTSDTRGHEAALKAQVDKLEVELKKLGPSPCDAIEEKEKEEAARVAAEERATRDAARAETMQQVLAVLPFCTSDQVLAALEACDYNMEATINRLLGVD